MQEIAFLEILLSCSPYCILGVLIFVVLLALDTLAKENAPYNKDKYSFWKNFAEVNAMTFNQRGKYVSLSGVYLNCHFDIETDLSKEAIDIAVKIPFQKKKHPQAEGTKGMPEEYALNKVINLLMPADFLPITGTVDVKSSHRKIVYTNYYGSGEPKFLPRICTLLAHIANGYPNVVALGGEIVPALQKIAQEKSHILQNVAIAAIKDIVDSSVRQVKGYTTPLICPHCLTYFVEYTVHLTIFQSFTYYGCQTCGQSQSYFRGDVIAVLDNQMTAESVKKGKCLRVNYLALRTLFDFDRVEIIEATDEAVERFAVSVGNDTDIVRKARYKKMTCTISSACQLSNNTHRILSDIFSKVEIKDK